MRRASPKSAEYAKGVNDSAKVGEVIQLVERAIKPANAGARFAVVVSIVALVVACAALVRTFLR
jgi:hypothetical protein